MKSPAWIYFLPSILCCCCCFFIPSCFLLLDFMGYSNWMNWHKEEKRRSPQKIYTIKKTIPNPYILIILIWVPLGRVRGSDACQHTQIQYMYPQLWCFYIKRYDRINWRTRQIRIKMWFVSSPSCIHTVICTKNHFSILLTYKKIEIFRRANWIFGAKWIWK